MNPLNQITKQISDLVQSMTPQARIMAGLLFATIVISLGWIVSVQQTTSYEYLLGGKPMTEDQLARVEEAFGDNGLADYARDGMRIKIPKATKDIYLKALKSSQAMPQPWHWNVDQSLNSEGPFQSVDSTKSKIEAAQEKELARIIERIPSVHFAAVEYDEQRQGFARKVEQTACVHVQSNGVKSIDKDVMRNIAYMTASYFAGLKPENVTVMELGSTTLYKGSSNPNAADQNPLLQAQSDWEQKYLNQLHPLLDNYGDVRLAVGVEIDPTLQKESEQLKYDPTVTTLQSQTSKKDSENSKLPPGGRPGADPNVISNSPQSVAASQPQQQTKAKEIAENVNGVAGHEATAMVQAGLVPTKVSVTVGLPESYYRKLWVLRAMAKDSKLTKEADVPVIGDEDMKKLKEEAEASVKGAISGVLKQVREGDDRFPLVTVYNYADFPVPEVPKPAMSTLAMGWLAESWSTVALLVVVMTTLFMMMGWVKAQSTAPRDKEFAQGFGIEVPASASDELDLGETGAEAKEAEGKEQGPKFQVTGGEMKEDLSTLVKQNPEIAVNLLKAWIGEAA
jgi:flagellar M-ring protein FliF